MTNFVKTVVLTVLSLAVTTDMFASVKVVERSSKKTPEWLGGIEQEYIITSADADNLERAKAICMENIRTSIIESVAQNVQSSSVSTISQESMTSGVTDFIDKFSTTYKTQAAKVPFLTGISESKAEDFYWEKRLDKQTGKTTWFYAVKYPFPRIELKRLVDIFNTNDNKMNERYEALEEAYNNIGSIEQIDDAIRELKVLSDYFFDDVRKNNATLLMRSYGALYSQVVLVPTEQSAGVWSYVLKIGDKEVSCSSTPTLKSETLADLRAEKDGNRWNIFYDYSTADPTEINTISLSQKVGGRYIRQQITIDLASSILELKPMGCISAIAETVTDSIVGNIVLRMDLSSNKKVTIKRVSFSLPCIATPVENDDLNIVLNGKGIYPISITFGKEYAKSVHPAAINIVRGAIYAEDESGTLHRVPVSIMFNCNWSIK